MGRKLRDYHCRLSAGYRADQIRYQALGAQLSDYMPTLLHMEVASRCPHVRNLMEERARLRAKLTPMPDAEFHAHMVEWHQDYMKIKTLRIQAQAEMEAARSQLLSTPKLQLIDEDSYWAYVALNGQVRTDRIQPNLLHQRCYKQ